MNPQPNTPASFNEAVTTKFKALETLLVKLFPEDSPGQPEVAAACEALRFALAAPGAAIAAREQEAPELLLGWKRYEKARKLSPFQWNRLHIRNLAGENFDAMIDSLPEPTTPVPTPSEALCPATVAQPVGWAAVHFGGKRDGKIYNTCDTRDEVDAYIQQVHQSSDSLTLTARPLVFADAAPSTLTDAELGAVAYKGFDDYWTEDSPGRERDAWTASAKAVLKAAQPCASQGCGGAVLPNLVRQLLATCDIDDGTTGLVKEVRAALSTAPRSLDGKNN